MARKKIKPGDRAAALTEFSSAMAARVEAHNVRLEEVCGDSVRPMPIVGLRLPHLSLRYAFRRNVVVFGRSYVVYGPEGSGKSAFLYWLYKLFVDAGGYYRHIELEDKDQPDLRRSVTGYPERIVDKAWVNRAETINQYQQLYHLNAEWFKKICRESNVGRTLPYISGIDALTSKLADQSYKAFVKNHGGVTQRFGEGANAIAQWLRMATNVLHGWPSIVVGVNHDKPTQDDHGNEVHQSPGGRAIGFHASTRVRIERTRYLPRTADGTEGMQVRLSVDKNSASVTGQRVLVDFLWNATEATRARPQRSWWDFDSATVRLLATLLEDERTKAAVKQGIRDATGLRLIGRGLYACKAVGVPASDPQDEAVIGALLEQSPAMADLEKVLEVRQAREFRPGDDMEEVMETMAPGAPSEDEEYAAEEAAAAKAAAKAAKEAAKEAAKAAAEGAAPGGDA